MTITVHIVGLFIMICNDKATMGHIATMLSSNTKPNNSRFSNSITNICAQSSNCTNKTMYEQISPHPFIKQPEW